MLAERNKCPMFGDLCEHCSLEHTSRIFTKIAKNSVTGLFQPVGLGKHTVDLGQWCNNAPIGSAGWVVDMHYCPSRWGLRGGCGKVVAKKKMKAVIKKPIIKKKITKK